MSLNTVFEKTYQAGFEPLLEQMVSKFKPLVSVKTFNNAEEFYMNQIGGGNGVISSIADLSATTSFSTTPTARRQITKASYAYHELILDNQLDNMSFDPESDITTNILGRFARTVDDLLITAAQATANTGKEGGTSTALPAGNTIAHGSTGMTYDKILAGVEKFLGADYAGGPVSLVVGPKQVRELMNVDKFIDNDFARLQGSEIGSAMLSGYVGTLKPGLTVNIFTSTRLAVATNIRDCLMFSPQGIGLGIGKNVEVRTGYNPERNMQHQISVIATMGASRLDEEQVYVIEADES